MHIKRFNWSQKTYSKLYRLGILDTEDFEGVSIKALKEMGIPEKTIKQIEDICKVHNIETKEIKETITQYSIYEFSFRYNDYEFPYDEPRDFSARYIADNEELATANFLKDWNTKESNHYLVGYYTVKIKPIINGMKM